MCLCGIFKKHMYVTILAAYFLLIDFFFSVRKLKALVQRPQITLKFLSFKYASEIHDLKRNYPKGMKGTVLT